MGIDLDVLNEPQRRAVESLEGPLLVLAGAGSGKTKMLVTRIGFLIENRMCQPYQILAVTFTNKAAKEMKLRVESLLGVDSETVGHALWKMSPQIGTFHSICLNLLRREKHLLPFAGDFSIYDDGEQQSLIRQVMFQLDIDSKVVSPKAIQGEINRCKCDYIGPDGVDSILSRLPKGYYQQRFREIYRLYQNILVQNRALDFGDIICRAVDILMEHEDVRAKYQSYWRYIHVDEYQDTNRSQYLLLKILAHREYQGHENICVVGDEDQSIYSWRGADIQNILNFQNDYPQAQTIKLEQNYRCTDVILGACNSVIRHNKQRYDKKLWSAKESSSLIEINDYRDEREESIAVVGQIATLLKERGLSLSEIAIFYRTNAQSRPFEDILRKHKIAYRIYGGLRFYDRKEIKDVLSFFKAITNPDDAINLKRIVNVPARGIGKTSIEKVEEIAAQQNRSFWEALKFVAQTQSNSMATKFLRFKEMLEGFARESLRRSVLDLFHFILDETRYVDHLRAEGSVEAEARLANLEEFDRVIQEFESQAEVAGLPVDARLKLFIEETTLNNPADLGEPQQGIQLMTFHASKGLEFEVVFMVGMEEGVFPSLRFDYLTAESPKATVKKELEEERRLCYVGMTRAKSRLFLTHVHFRTVWGQTLVQQPSRFLSEIPEQYVVASDRGKSDAGQGSEDEDGDSDDFSVPKVGSKTSRASARFSARD
jgi:DNA helicase-2/ATP-dependent DNA helicase PcrA